MLAEHPASLGRQVERSCAPVADDVRRAGDGDRDLAAAGQVLAEQRVDPQTGALRRPWRATDHQTRPYPPLPPIPRTAGTIAALLTLREQVIGPILTGVRSPRMGRKPDTWTRVDRDYEKIRIDMQTLFQDLGIRAAA